MLGISLRTAQLWVDSGLLEAWRTEGGHRRITLDSVERLRRTNSDSLLRIPADKPDSSANQHKALRILIAEHDNLLLRLYKLRFEGWGLPIAVCTASNAYEALLLVGRESPDLMITDLRMPGLDPIRMLHSLSGSSYRDGMEIAVVTGMDMNEMAQKEELPPSVRLFPKPVPFEELRALVEQLLARRAAF